jgi:hypothetical protein
MKTSPLNLLIQTGIGAASSSVEVEGKEAANILVDDSLNVYASQGNFDVTIFNVGSISLDVIALVNVYFDEQLVIELYDAANIMLYSQTFTPADMSGFEIKYIYMEVPATVEYINKIRVYSLGGDDYTEKYIGYIWAGLLIDFGCIESCQPMSMSNDAVQISRTDHPDINESYLYRELDLTIKKETEFKSARTAVESILTDGYGKGRPWILDEDLFDGEMIFAMLDSGKVKYDVKYTAQKLNGSNWITQFTIGLREVT